MPSAQRENGLLMGGTAVRNARTEVRPTSGALGAELLGIDLSNGLDADAVATSVRPSTSTAWYSSGTNGSRQNSISPLLSAWGPLTSIGFSRRRRAIHRSQRSERSLRKQPTSAVVGIRITATIRFPRSGQSYSPAIFPTHGGDTMFACMGQAYDALSDGLKRTLKGLRAVHSSRHVFGAKAQQANPDRKDRLVNPELATQDAVHPVVIRHPETGRSTLYVNGGVHDPFRGLD